MKKYIFYFSILSILICLGCQDDEIILSKPGEAVGPVTGLDYSISGNDVNISWDLPADFPDDIVEPVSINIRIAIDGRYQDPVTIENAPESYTFSSYESSKKYRFTVKVMANVENSDPAVSDLRYSLGETISF